MVISTDRPMTSSRDLTLLLHGMKAGDEKCESQFIAAVYKELKAIAANQLRGERQGHSLQPSALVNELYIRMMGRDGAGWENRAHFFASAASTMRRILIDRARARRANKRDGALQRVDLDHVPNLVSPAHGDESDRMIALDAALTELAAFDPRQAKLVEMRFFTGLTFEEAASVLGISSRTAKRDWNMARAWLLSRTSGAATP